MATDDLKARIEGFASAWLAGSHNGDCIYEITHHRLGSHKLKASDLTEAADMIATLEAQLAARDAPYTVDAAMQKAMEPLIRGDERIKVESEIAAWLREVADGAKKAWAEEESKPDMGDVFWRRYWAGYNTCAVGAATAIASGDYAKGQKT